MSGATSWQRLKYIEFWSAMPHIVGGIKIAVQQAIVGTIIATGSGLGFLIVAAGKVFGVLITVMLVLSSFISWSR